MSIFLQSLCMAYISSRTIAVAAVFQYPSSIVWIRWVGYQVPLGFPTMHFTMRNATCCEHEFILEPRLFL